MVFADEAEWWEWKWSFSVRGVLEQLDDATRDAFRKAAFAAMQPLREESGFPMSLAALFALADRASTWPHVRLDSGTRPKCAPGYRALTCSRRSASRC